MNAKPGQSVHWLVWSLALIVLFGLAPLLVAVAASSIGNTLGCTVNEGGASSCLFMGHDIGETLADMFVFGWLMFVTLPAAGIAFLLWFVAAIVVFVRRRRLHSSEA
jgi:hypothetical protein